MNQAIKTQWVEALRSGKYAQGQETLMQEDPKTNDKKYCCLGVLCDLYIEATGNGHWSNNKDLRYFSHVPFAIGSDSSTGLPLEEVVNWAELPANSPTLYVDGELIPQQIDKLNDDGLTFDQIATLIEKQL